MKNIYIILVLLLVVSISQAKEIYYKFSQEEVDEVNKLYYECDGENWNNNIGWPLSSASFSPSFSPYGITVDLTDEIISSNSNVTIYLANVKVINFTQNNLRGEIPDFDLPELVTLELRSNQLSGEIPDFILPNLEFLDLGANMLEDEIPDFKLPKLLSLKLFDNKLRGKIPNFILPNLEDLDLSGNKLKSRIPEFDLPSLKSLYLHSNELTGKIPDFNLPNLKILTLSSNKFTFGALETIVGRYGVSFCNDTICYQDTILPIIQTGNILEVITDGTANTYVWFLDGELIIGANQKTIKPTKDGSYKCMVKNDHFNFLTFISEEYDFIYKSISSAEINNLKIIQDGDELKIKYNTIVLIQNIEIFSSNGNLVYSSNNVSKTINTSRMVNGVYFVHLNTGGDLLKAKFLVSR